jgi:hypothetical protein
LRNENKINESQIKNPNHPEIENSVDEKINKIINKYSKHQVTEELDVFSKMFKNYNSTNTKNIDIKNVNNQIQNVLKINGINNILDNKKENKDIQNKQHLVTKNKNVMINLKRNVRNIKSDGPINFKGYL